MPATPPTSPQHAQAAGRHSERTNRTIGSPDQRRIPAIPSDLSTITALPLPSISREPTSYNGQTYHHLSTNLAERIANLPPIPVPPQRSHRYSVQSLLPSAPVSLIFAFIN